MLEISVGLLFLAVAAAFLDWRHGLFACVLIAILQDPLRKLTPGEPVIYVVLVALVFGAAALGAILSRISLAPTRIWEWRRYLHTPFIAYIGVLIFQSANALMRTGNFIVPLIGFSAYVTPFLAVGVIYQTVLRSPPTFLNNFLKFYFIIISVALMTVGLEFIGYKWSIFGEVGQRLVIFDQTTGAMLSAKSGIFRTSEVAAWHAATCVCFFAIWIVNRRITPSKALMAGIFVTAIVALGIITGRRKFLVEIVVFIAAYSSLLIYFGRGTKLAVLSGIVGLTCYLAFAIWLPEGPAESIHRTVQAARDAQLGDTQQGEQYRNYVSRTQGVFKDIPDRLKDLGFAPIAWAYEKYGLLGAGLGVGSQGVQNFGVKGQGAAEGGLGKIWLELGAPGFLIIGWLTWAFFRQVWLILKFVGARSAALHRTACGLASFLLANMAAFAVATQVYGDFFVLLLLGTALGALLAIPVLTERVLQARILSLSRGTGSRLAVHPA